MSKPTEEAALEHAQEYITEFYSADSIRNWFRYELLESYKMIDGDCSGIGQWADDDYQHFHEMKMPIVTTNFISPVVDAISGFEIQNPMTVDYMPRLSSEEAQGFSDMMDKTAAWMREDSEAQSYDSEVVRDVLACGVGCSDYYIAYDKPPNEGNTIQERVFPGMCGWDASAHQSNLQDAECVWRMKLIRKKAAEKLIKQHKGKDYEVVDTGLSRSFSSTNMLDLLNQHQYTDIPLELIFQYQWREYEPFYRVLNPFHDFAKPDGEMNPIDAVMMQYAASAEEIYGIRMTDKTFNLGSDKWNDFNRDMKNLGLEVEKAKLERWKYYRSILIGGNVITVEENASQRGFTQKFMTGKYSEVEKMFYGAVRGMKEPQRIFNRSLSRLEKLQSKAALGGDIVEIDAVPDGDVQGFLDTKALAEASGTLFVAPGALSGGKVLPRQNVQLPAGMMDMFAISKDALYGSPGITPALMGEQQQGDESGLLYSRKVKQGMAVLSWILVKARKLYLTSVAELYVDFGRVMAQNSPGRMIRVVGDDKQQYIRLFEDNIADEYDYVVTTKPYSPDERFEFSKLLLALAPQIPQLATLALDGLPYDKKSIDEVKQSLLPAPAPPPDPANQALIQAETENKIAQATANTAKAKLTEAQTLTEIEALQNPPQVIYDAHERNLKEREMQLKEREMALKEHETDMKAADMAARMMTPQPMEQMA